MNLCNVCGGDVHIVPRVGLVENNFLSSFAYGIYSKGLAHNKS